MCKPRGLKCGSLRLPTLSPWSRGIEITLNLNNFSISERIPTWRLLSFLWESLLLQFLCRYCGKISHPWGAVLLRFWATPGVSPWVSVSNNDTDVISLEAITPLTWTAFATSPWKNWRCVWKKILGRKWRRWGTGFSRKFQAGAKLLVRGSFGTWSLAPATMIEVLPFGRWCLRQLQAGRAGTATSTEALTIKEKKLRYNQLSLRSRPFDFWGGLWVISEKKILQTDLTGAKIVQGNTRNTGTCICYTVICRGKNSDLTQSISLIHPCKSQMVESFTDIPKIRTPPWMRYSKLPAQSSVLLFDPLW